MIDDLHLDPAELAAADAQMRAAARHLFARPEGDLFDGSGAVPRVTFGPRASEGARETARGLFSGKQPDSPLAERLRRPSKGV